MDYWDSEALKIYRSEMIEYHELTTKVECKKSINMEEALDQCKNAIEKFEDRKPQCHTHYARTKCDHAIQRYERFLKHLSKELDD